MYSLIKNPISYSIVALAILFVVISFGESPILVAQHILIPYTVDVSRGVGDIGASLFRVVTLISQCLMCLFVYVTTRLQSSKTRLAVSVIGILSAAFYFFVVAFGYVMPRLH